MAERTFEFSCPCCAIALSNQLTCANCATVFEKREGIYRFLLPDRSAEIQPFLTQYRRVRERDGYRSFTGADYVNLPYVRPQGVMADVWRVRQQSYDHLVTLLDKHSRTILDLGAGNGWLSHRLTKLGHRLAAVDWLDDEKDGLGAHRHYPVQFTCVQADFDMLPFATRQFDVVIFNASLHYGPDLTGSLSKAYKLVKPNGQIFLMDSPTFHSDRSGQIMLKEQAERLRADYDLQDVVQPGIGFLTDRIMNDVGKTLGIAFRFYRSFGAPLWAMKRWLSGVMRRREPAAFGVWAGRLI